MKSRGNYWKEKYTKEHEACLRIEERVFLLENILIKFMKENGVKDAESWDIRRKLNAMIERGG